MENIIKLNRKRDTYVDVAKGIGIMLIVSIHTEVFGVMGYPLSFIAVPVFFFMSGFYDRAERNIDQWFPKSLRTLILPAIIWILIATAYIKLLGYVKDRSWGENPFNFYIMTGGNGPAWFLFALLYAKVLTWGLMKIKMPKWAIWGGSLLIGYVGMNINMPLLFDEGCAALPLYITGKLAYPYLRKITENKGLFVAGVIALCLYLWHLVSFTIVPQSNGDFAPYYLVALGLMFLCFVPFLFISEKLQNQKWLASFGQHSLGIMLLHAPMCHTAAVILNRVFEPASLYWIVSFLIAYVAIVFVSYWGTVLIERYIPIMLGKKI